MDMLNVKNATPFLRWLVLFSIASFTSDLYATGSSMNSATKGTDCPCAYDEPFTSVLSQVKNNPTAWAIGSIKRKDSTSGELWQGYQLLKRGHKSHTLWLKLTGNRTIAHLSCSWTQWSYDGTKRNDIGMGHHLYLNKKQGEKARVKCVDEITSHITKIATPFVPEVENLEPLTAAR